MSPKYCGVYTVNSNHVLRTGCWCTPVSVHNQLLTIFCVQGAGVQQCAECCVHPAGRDREIPSQADRFFSQGTHKINSKLRIGSSKQKEKERTIFFRSIFFSAPAPVFFVGAAPVPAPSPRGQKHAAPSGSGSSVLKGGGMNKK